METLAWPPRVSTQFLSDGGAETKVAFASRVRAATLPQPARGGGTGLAFESMDTVARHFLGWERPVLDTVAERLLAGWSGGPLDLSGVCMVVPTAHSGRRLRERLAKEAASRGTGVLSGLVLTPEMVVRTMMSGHRPASASQGMAAWIGALRGCDLRSYSALFPVPPPAPLDFAWLLATGQRLHRLRRELGENLLSFADVARLTAASESPEFAMEAERWRDLARIEAEYVGRLEAMGFEDELRLLSRWLAHPEPVLGLTAERFVMAAVPDPLPSVCRVLAALSEQIEVEVWVAAPESLAGLFDEWGRPVATAWEERSIEWPEEVRAGGEGALALHLCSRPAAEAETAAGMVMGRPGAVQDFAVGVLDPEVAPALESRLAAAGIPVFDPAGKPLRQHRLAVLLGILCDLMGEDPEYAAVASALRQPDILRWCVAQARAGIEPGAVLAELDAFQNRHMPGTLAEMRGRLEEDSTARGRFPCLAAAVRGMERLAGRLREDPSPAAVTGCLAEIFAGRSVGAEGEDVSHFAEAAEILATGAEALADLATGRAGLLPGDVLRLFAEDYRGGRITPERIEGSLDIEGWLELLWDDASRLIVAGMNDGLVPEAVVGDAFLPEGARRLLGVRTNAMRLARDAFILQVLLSSRRDGGRVMLLVGKRSTKGDPLRPSRLLFLCSDEELVRRAALLFGEVPREEPSPPRTISWRLRVPAGGVESGHLSITALKDYLACPFRFYLKHVLRMEAVDDRKAEMDSLDFGNICHGAFERLARESGLSAGGDERLISEFLVSQAEALVARQFGRRLTIPLQVQLESIRQRLRAAGRILAQESAGGWQVVDVERVLGADGHGLSFGQTVLRGRVDRIERHRDGRVRLLDFKTGDQVVTPAQDHLAPAAEDEDSRRCVMAGAGNRRRRWINLQLPLYRAALTAEFGPDIVAGYFVLPKAVRDTEILIWEELDDALTAAAVTCAETVVADIAAGRFWPPAARVKYDEFEGILFGDAEAHAGIGA